MRFLALYCFGVLALGSAIAAGGPSKEDMTMSTNDPAGAAVAMGASMAPPPVVDPVAVDGIRIELAVTGLPLDAADTNGWLRAFDTASGEELWTAQAFTAPPRDPDEPMTTEDPARVDVVTMQADGAAVLIEDSLGRRFRVDPKTGASTPVN
ncbi:hypothetical protein RGUI_3064 [Rhodovulum sp. P5]|uniref:hypothetical protein n=1 Tax=Rhodovulum sp. P5 TaxID=1564506 RepID=UPI0009C3AD4E|nr:hypothetical protein [Rhodovulum sp. P5]ARE41205.1 hypothetical protein RGUI_3064 [Rhodovulum sp. P5]